MPGQSSNCSPTPSRGPGRDGQPQPTSSPGSEAGPSPLTSPDGPGSAPSGPAPAPASHFHRPANAEGLRTTGTSGLFGESLSASDDLQSSLENRLLQRMAGHGSIEYALTWKRWAMPSGPPICALRSSHPRTRDKGSTGWPTTGAADGTKRPKYHGRGEGNPSLGTAAKMAGWSSPKVKTGGANSKRAERGAGGPNLQEQVGWTTPCGHDTGGRKTPYAQGGVPLDALAGWTTPIANDAEKRGRVAGTNSLQGQAQHSGEMDNSSLAETTTPAVLSAEHSRWLMGFPGAWGLAAPNRNAYDWMQQRLATGECSAGTETP